MTVDGYFQEYVAIKWRNAALIPDDMDLSDCAPLYVIPSTSNPAVTDFRKDSAPAAPPSTQ